MAAMSIARLPPDLQRRLLPFLSAPDVARLSLLGTRGAERFAAAAYAHRCGTLHERDAVRAYWLGESDTRLDAFGDRAPPPPPKQVRFCAAVGRERAAAALLRDTSSNWENATFDFWLQQSRSAALGGAHSGHVWLRRGGGGRLVVRLSLQNRYATPVQATAVPALGRLFEYPSLPFFVPPLPTRPNEAEWHFYTRRRFADFAATLLVLFGDRLLLRTRPSAAATVRRVIGPLPQVAIRRTLANDPAFDVFAAAARAADVRALQNAKQLAHFLEGDVPL
jgi:hypothetical protein